MLAKTRRPSWTSRLADRSRTSWSGQGAFLYSPKRAGLPGHPGQPTVPGHPGRAEKPKQKKTDHPLLAKTSRPSWTSRLADHSRTSWSGRDGCEEKEERRSSIGRRVADLSTRCLPLFVRWGPNVWRRTCDLAVGVPEIRDFAARTASE